MNLELFLQAFIFIFLASLPGRTTFLMMVMAAHAKISNVLIGAGLAFVVQCAISIALGNLLSFVPERALHVLVGVLFIYFAFQFWRSSRQRENIADKKSQVSIRNVFSVVFAGEWGDVSQVAIATFAAEHKEKSLVFGAAVFALWLTTLIAVGAGKILNRSLKPQYIQLIAAIGFACVGIYMLARAIFD